MYKPFHDLIEGKNLLELDKDGKPADRKLRVAVAGVLWAMVNADSEQNKEEFVRAIQLIEHEFHLMDEDSGDLIAIADLLDRDGNAFESFIDQVNSHYDRTQRQHLYDMIWKIAEADGYVDTYEKGLALYLQEKLGLT